METDRAIERGGERKEQRQTDRVTYIEKERWRQIER